MKWFKRQPRTVTFGWTDTRTGYSRSVEAHNVKTGPQHVVFRSVSNHLILAVRAEFVEDLGIVEEQP